MVLYGTIEQRLKQFKNGVTMFKTHECLETCGRMSGVVGQPTKVVHNFQVTPQRTILCLPKYAERNSNLAVSFTHALDGWVGSSPSPNTRVHVDGQLKNWHLDEWGV